MEVFGPAQCQLSAQLRRVWLVLCLGRRVSRNLLCEVGEYLRSPLLPCFRGQLLHLVDLETHKVSVLRLSTRFAHNCYYCLISPQQVLSFPYDSPLVYSLDLSTFALSSLPPMGIARSDQGAVVFDACVYVFGGDWLKSNECYDPHLGRWGNLAHSHYCYFMLSPCAYLTQIYLPQPDKTEGHMDVYTPLYGTFALVPAPTQDLSRSIAFVHSAGLIWLTAQGDLIEKRLDVAQVSICHGAFEGCIVPGNSTPVRLGSMVYWTTAFGDQVYTFSLEKRAIDVLHFNTRLLP